MWLQAGLQMTGLVEPDDFTTLRVVAARPDHVWLTRERLVEIAGPRGQDPGWLASLDAMLAYAASKGWVDGDGAVRAHVDWS